VPEKRRRLCELHANLGFPVGHRPQVDHFALLLFLSPFVFQQERLVEFHLHHQDNQRAVGIHDQRLRFFPDGLRAFHLALDQNRHGEEHPLAASLIGRRAAWRDLLAHEENTRAAAVIRQEYSGPGP